MNRVRRFPWPGLGSKFAVADILCGLALPPRHFITRLSPQLLYSAPGCQARPGQPQLCSPPHSKAWRTPVIPLFGRGHSFAPALHKPALPRAGGVKDGAATTKGGLSLTAPSTVACWMPLGPRTSSMPLAGPCFSSGWTRRPSQDGMRKMKRNNLRGVLTVAHTVGTSCGAISLHPSSREGHLPPEAAETSSCVSVSRIGPAAPSGRGSLLLRPLELGAINPDAVHDDGEPARQRHDCPFQPAVLGDLHGPGLEP